MDTLLAPTSQPMPLPAPRVAVSVRSATADDLPFIDSLQKKTSKQVGFMPTAQLAGKVSASAVLIAEAAGDFGLAMGDFGSGEQFKISNPKSKIGYLIGHDQYFKRDDVGVIYQINVAPEFRRSLVAATLLQAQFDRSAYGCKLYCCWCAQDLEANRFWESMGFVPLAFRTGSERKSRVHIFWQKRIRQGDVSTPWWFPSQTTGGSIRADRLVLPIPPGTHWSDAKPLVLPGAAENDECRVMGDESKKPAKRRTHHSSPITHHSPLPVKRNGLFFDIPKQGEPLPAHKPPKAAKAKPQRVKARNEPHLVAAARELRDRWLDEVNAGRFVIEPAGKYDVARLPPPAATKTATVALLPAA